MFRDRMKAAEIACRLWGEVNVVLVRKLAAPHNPELAIGAVDETGWAFVADHARAVGATLKYIEEEKRRQLEVLRRRRARYTPGCARPSIPRTTASCPPLTAGLAAHVVSITTPVFLERTFKRAFRIASNVV